MLCQLSYAPRFEPEIVVAAILEAMPAPSQRTALGTLFLLLALAFAGIATPRFRPTAAAPGSSAWPPGCLRSGWEAWPFAPSCADKIEVPALPRRRASRTRASQDPQRRRRRAPRHRQDLARRGDAVPVPAPSTGSARSRRARPSPTGTTTSTSGRCRSRRRSATSSGRAARSTSRRAGRPGLPGRRDRGAARRRGRAVRRQRRHGRRGQHDAAPGSAPRSTASRASSS